MRDFFMEYISTIIEGAKLNEQFNLSNKQLEIAKNEICNKICGDDTIWNYVDNLIAKEIKNLYYTFKDNTNLLEYERLQKTTKENQNDITKMQIINDLMCYEKFNTLPQIDQAKLFEIVYELYTDNDNEEFTIVDIIEIIFNNFVSNKNVGLTQNYSEIKEFVKEQMEIYGQN